MSSVDLPRRVDVLIVGGGIVGLAAAYQIVEAAPATSVLVCETEPVVGRHQSSRNSGVLHAGLYYTPGSSKAEWCVRGKLSMEAFCEHHGIEVARRGKVVVAVDEKELPGLHRLADRAERNGVRVQMLGPDGVREREPHARGVAGIWSPNTAVTDFGKVTEVLAGLLQDRGGIVATGTRVLALEDAGSELRVRTDRGDVEATAAVTCAGTHADRIAGPDVAGAEGLRILPVRGSWWRLSAEKQHLVRGNIYPVPIAGGLPFLGVHLTRRLDGQVWIGPNAVPALARTGDRPWSVDGATVREVVGFPGTWRLGRKHATTAAGELWRDRVRLASARAVRRYVPDISAEDLESGPWGVRAQLLDARGNLVDDFTLRQSGRVLHVLNAPSPAATASLEIGAALRDRVLPRVS